MIIFDEREYASDMNVNLIRKVYTQQEMVVYCKWLRWNIFQKKSDEEAKILLKKILITFCEMCWDDFDKDVDYKKINKAVDTAMKEQIRNKKPIFVSKKEWETIISVANVRAQRVLFIMLVVAKFNRTNPIFKINEPETKYEDIRLRCNLSIKDIYGLAKIKFKKNENKYEVWKYYDNIVELVDGQKLRRILLFADIEVDEDEIFMEIKDYNNIIWYYEKEFNNKIKECVSCGKLFKDDTKTQNLKLCGYCRGLKKNIDQDKVFICEDCGKRVVLKGDAKKGKQTRCIECYRKYRSECIKQNVANYREKEKM